MAFELDILAKNEQGARCQFTRNGSKLSFNEIFHLWQSTEHIEHYLSGIKNLGFDQFYWEHPALTEEIVHLPYECMLVKTDHFNHRTVDTTSFSAYLQRDESVAVFDNLGRNARLVVPTLKSHEENYKHFGAFLNFAPTIQISDLFNAVACSILEELHKGKTIWLSTAGLGVIWLHIRLDTVPKYYKTKTYKDATFLNRRKRRF